MYRVPPSKTKISSYILLSSLGALLALGVAIYPSYFKLISTSPNLRKLVIGSIFIGICILGLIATIFPSKCMTKKPISELEQEPDNMDYELEGSSRLCGVSISHAHHPACEEFDPHELIIKRKSICAGCLGLSIGTIISILSSVLYFGGLSTPAISLAPYFIVFGIISNMMMFGRYLLPKIGSTVRIILHVAMVLGSTFLLIGIDLIGQSYAFDYLAILLALIWLRTKLLLTKWEHNKVCKLCNDPCNDID